MEQKTTEHLQVIRQDLETLNRLIAETISTSQSPAADQFGRTDELVKSVRFGLEMMIDDLVHGQRILKEQNTLNGMRARVWELAADRDLSEQDLLQGLLDTVGPDLGVSRACYNIIEDKKITCTMEWCREKVKPSLGFSVPVSIIKKQLEEDVSILTRADLETKVPAGLRKIARPVIDRLEKTLNLVSIVMIPCRIGGTVEGTITFDVCADQTVKPEWTEYKIAFLEELVRIITQAITTKRMETSLVRSKEDLEKRVQDRTAQLQNSLDEKEVLLKEIHHRVKNNLQIVSSLLNLHTGHIDDPGARTAIQDSQSRIKSMALIHEKLYQSTDLTKVDFAGYVRKLTSDLFHMYSAHGRVGLDVRIGQIPLSINRAIPCGLIINELVSNALKHAFPDKRKGAVSVAMEERKGGSVELSVADDGIGLPGHIGFESAESLGLQLVHTLSNQIDGDLAVERDKGTVFRLTFTL